MTAYQQLAARLTIAAVGTAGLLVLGFAVMSPDLEWRLAAMAVLAAAVSRQSAEIRIRDGGAVVNVPLVHPVLFASSLALGPIGCALPGAFCGIARLFTVQNLKRPVYDALYTMLKPAAVCAGASLVYVMAGGNVLSPQGADSLVPALLSACAYVAINSILVAIAEVISGREAAPVPRAGVLTGGWLACMAAGYVLAALYAFAPTYLLFVPIAAAAVIRLGLREQQDTELEKADMVEEEVEAEPEEEQETPGQTMEFVDRLTGLANQRYLDMFLQREVSRAQRTGSSISLALFELGDFDKHCRGKDRGAAENVLIEMGDRLKAALREYDLVARYAAGRMAVVLPDTSAVGAIEVALRLHESLASLKMGRNPALVTVGIATFPLDGDDARDLINSCHRALNRGKYEGENKVYSNQILRKVS